VRRVALLDFDVHHGNGTQACVARVVPQVIQYATGTPMCEGTLRFQSFHPWLDADDADNILFAR
jgi:acetoin utilization deacetylase AcuC-like enzyme